MLKKITAVLGAALIAGGTLVAAPVTVFAAPGDPVNIPDAELKAALVFSLGLPYGYAPDLTEGELASVTALNLNGRPITDLTGLEYAVDMNGLDMEGTLVTDLTPLSGMTNLGVLRITDNPVSDVSMLPTQITTLDMGGTLVTDLSQLAGFTSLGSLNISNLPSGLTNETTVSTLTTLNSLNISGNTDLVPVAFDVTNLLSLTMNDVSVTTLDGIENLTSLMTLFADDVPLTNADALLSVPTLLYVEAHNTKLTSAEAFAGLDGVVTSSLSATTEVGGTPLTLEALDTAGDQIVFDDVDGGTYDSVANTLFWGTDGVKTVTWDFTSVLPAFEFSGEYVVNVDIAAMPVPISSLVSYPRIDSALLGWAAPNTNGFGVVTDYIIEYSDDGGVTFTTLNVPASDPAISQSGTNYAYTVAGLVAGTEYTFNVRYETDMSVTSLPSNSPTATPIAAFLDAPANFVVTTDGTDFFLSWDAVAGATGYVVNGVDTSGIGLASILTTGTTTTIPVAGVDPDSTLHLWVNAGDAGGATGSTSAVVAYDMVTGTFGVGEAAPAAPTNFSAVQDATNLTVTWDAIPNDEQYRILVQGLFADSSTTGSYWVGTNTLVIPLVDLVEDEAYHFNIGARTQFSSWSNWLEDDYTVTGAPVVAPTPFFTVTVFDANTLLVEFNESIGANLYQLNVQQMDSLGGYSVEEASSPIFYVDITGFTASQLILRGSAMYEAPDSTRTLVSTEAARIYTLDTGVLALTTTPPAPVVVASISEDGTSVTITWAAAPGATEYAVYLYSMDSFTDFESAVQSGTSITIPLSEFNVGEEYGFSVAGRSDTSSWSFGPDFMYTVTGVAGAGVTPGDGDNNPATLDPTKNAGSDDYTFFLGMGAIAFGVGLILVPMVISRRRKLAESVNA